MPLPLSDNRVFELTWQICDAEKSSLEDDAEKAEDTDEAHDDKVTEHIDDQLQDQNSANVSIDKAGSLLLPVWFDSDVDDDNMLYLHQSLSGARVKKKKKKKNKKGATAGTQVRFPFCFIKWKMSSSHFFVWYSCQ